MHAVLRHTRRAVQQHSSFFHLTALFLAATVAFAAFNSRTAVAADPPVITLFKVRELSNGVWRLSGTLTAPEGIEGLVLHFGGSLLNETDDANSDGTFLLDVAVDPEVGDWAEVYATSASGLNSETETEYF